MVAKRRAYALLDDGLAPPPPKTRPRVRMTAAEHQARQRYRDVQRGLCLTCGASTVNGRCALCAEERTW